MHLLPAGRWPHTAATAGSNACQLQVAVDTDAGRAVVVARSTTSARAPPARRCSARTCARPGRDRRAVGQRRRAVSATAARGFRAAGGHRRAQGQRRARRRAGGQRRPAGGRRRRVHRQPGARPRRCCGPSRSSPAAGSSAVVLNSGGANACTGPDGFADTHATAERVAAALGTGAARRRGLLDRPDRRAAADGPAAAGRRPRPPPRCPRDGGPAAAEAIRTTDTVAKTAVAYRRRLDGRRDGQGRRRCWPRRSPRCLRSLTTDAVADSALLDEALRAATRVTLRPGRLRRLHVDQRHRAAAGQRGERRDPGPRRAARRRDGRLRRPGPAAGRRRRGRDQGHRHRGGRRRRRGRRAWRSPGRSRRSNLLKCALYGHDPNWGRVLAAVGTTRAAFEPDAVDVAINGVQVCRGGAPGDDRDQVDLSGREVHDRRRPARRPRHRDALDQRPDRRVRPRELGVLDVSTAPRPGGTWRCPRPPPSSRRCPGSRRSPVAPSS